MGWSTRQHTLEPVPAATGGRRRHRPEGGQEGRVVGLHTGGVSATSSKAGRLGRRAEVGELDGLLLVAVGAGGGEHLSL